MKQILYRLYTFLKEHENQCKFFDEFGIFVQMILAGICLSVLLRINKLNFSKKIFRKA